jgi:hypothetical protein
VRRTSAPGRESVFDPVVGSARRTVVSRLESTASAGLLRDRNPGARNERWRSPGRRAPRALLRRLERGAAHPRVDRTVGGSAAAAASAEAENVTTGATPGTRVVGSPRRGGVNPVDMSHLGSSRSGTRSRRSRRGVEHECPGSASHVVDPAANRVPAGRRCRFPPRPAAKILRAEERVRCRVGVVVGYRLVERYNRISRGLPRRCRARVCHDTPGADTRCDAAQTERVQSVACVVVSDLTRSSGPVVRSGEGSSSLVWKEPVSSRRSDHQARIDASLEVLSSAVPPARTMTHVIRDPDN